MRWCLLLSLCGYVCAQFVWNKYSQHSKCRDIFRNSVCHFEWRHPGFMPVSMILNRVIKTWMETFLNFKSALSLLLAYLLLDAGISTVQWCQSSGTFMLRTATWMANECPNIPGSYKHNQICTLFPQYDYQVINTAISYDNPLTRCGPMTHQISSSPLVQVIPCRIFVSVHNLNP